MLLIDFLRQRLDEDEAAAREAGNRRWLVQDNIIELWPEREDDGFMSWPTRADARHAARWEPARVLAEVEAKRRIVELHAGEPYPNPDDEPVDAECTTFGADLRYPEQCRTLRLLALPYADHPDYDEAWRV